MGRSRKPSPGEEDHYCQKHGVGPHRRHGNGWDFLASGPKKSTAWRCVECLRARYKSKDE